MLKIQNKNAVELGFYVSVINTLVIEICFDPLIKSGDIRISDLPVSADGVN